MQVSVPFSVYQKSYKYGLSSEQKQPLRHIHTYHVLDEEFYALMIPYIFRRDIESRIAVILYDAFRLSDAVTLSHNSTTLFCAVAVDPVCDTCCIFTNDISFTFPLQLDICLTLILGNL